MIMFMRTELDDQIPYPSTTTTVSSNVEGELDWIDAMEGLNEAKEKWTIPFEEVFKEGVVNG